MNYPPVEIQNGLSYKKIKFPSHSILQMQWLYKNTFYITDDGLWDGVLNAPNKIILCMAIHSDNSFAAEYEREIWLGGIEYNDTKDVEVFIWYTEKQLKQQINEDIRATCIKFTSDFKDAAFAIVKSAQKKAKEYLLKEQKRRKRGYKVINGKNRKRKWGE
jgi:hypothetical protein